MYRELCRNFGTPLALSTATLVLGGCVQATRHSNTMIFGTNTTVGFKVGQNVNQVPEIMLAYDRQEAVIMPLLANVRERGGTGNLLTPCEPSASSSVTTAQGNPSTVVSQSTNQVGVTSTNGDGVGIHPCSFVGYRMEDGNLFIQDSYSVLASFGADFGGKVGTGTEATAGLAQYFATGIAAQLLAAEGGAALVATGRAAQTSEANSNGGGAAAVLGNRSALVREAGLANEVSMTGLQTKIQAAPDTTTLQRKMGGLLTALGLPAADSVRSRIVGACGRSKDACWAEFDGSRTEFSGYGRELDQAISDWDRY